MLLFELKQYCQRDLESFCFKLAQTTHRIDNEGQLFDHDCL